MRASSRPSWLSGPSAQCVRVEEEEEPSGRCVSGEWLKKTGPSFNMWFSSVQAEWKSNRFIALIGIQSSINITHPLIRSCCVCLHMLRAMWTGSYGPFSLMVGWNLLEQGPCCSEEMKDLSLKICHFQTLKKLMRSKVFCLYRYSAGSKEVLHVTWEGSAFIHLDVSMAAQSQTKVALTAHLPFCSNVQTYSGEHGVLLAVSWGKHTGRHTFNYSGA